MGQEGAIVAVAIAAAVVMIALAVVEFIRGADRIALTDGTNALYASKGQAVWS